MSTTSEHRQGARKLTVVLSLLAVALVAAGALVSLYFHPRHEGLGYGEVGTYYGLGWHSGPGYTGKNWFHLRAETYDGCWWEMDFEGYGDSATRGYYANGTLMENSVSLVEENAGQPWWERHQVRDGAYFDLNGKVVSEIKAGTGRQILFNANGTRNWELDCATGSGSSTSCTGPPATLRADFVMTRTNGPTAIIPRNTRMEYQSGEADTSTANMSESGTTSIRTVP